MGFERYVCKNDADCELSLQKTRLRQNVSWSGGEWNGHAYFAPVQMCDQHCNLGLLYHNERVKGTIRKGMCYGKNNRKISIKNRMGAVCRVMSYVCMQTLLLQLLHEHEICFKINLVH